MEQIYSIIEELKQLKQQIIDKFQAGEVDNTLLSSWIEKSVDLEEELAKKLDELSEKLSLLSESQAKEE